MQHFATVQQRKLRPEKSIECLRGLPKHGVIHELNGTKVDVAWTGKIATRYREHVHAPLVCTDSHAIQWLPFIVLFYRIRFFVPSRLCLLLCVACLEGDEGFWICISYGCMHLFAALPSFLDAKMVERVKAEALWIFEYGGETGYFARLWQKHKQLGLEFQEPEGGRYSNYIKSIEHVLEYLIFDQYDVPFISKYRKENTLPLQVPLFVACAWFTG